MPSRPFWACAPPAPPKSSTARRLPGTSGTTRHHSGTPRAPPGHHPAPLGITRHHSVTPGRLPGTTRHHSAPLGTKPPTHQSCFSIAPLQHTKKSKHNFSAFWACAGRLLCKATNAPKVTNGTAPPGQQPAPLGTTRAPPGRLPGTTRHHSAPLGTTRYHSGTPRAPPGHDPARHHSPPLGTTRHHPGAPRVPSRHNSAPLGTKHPTHQSCFFPAPLQSTKKIKTYLLGPRPFGLSLGGCWARLPTPPKSPTAPGAAWRAACIYIRPGEHTPGSSIAKVSLGTASDARK